MTFDPSFTFVGSRSGGGSGGPLDRREAAGDLAAQFCGVCSFVVLLLGLPCGVWASLINHGPIRRRIPLVLRRGFREV